MGGLLIIYCRESKLIIRGAKMKNEDGTKSMLHETAKQRDVINRILNIKPSSSDDRVRPYMPALVVYAIEGYLRNGIVWHSFDDLKNRFSGVVRSALGIATFEVKYPFWYLRYAPKVWILQCDKSLLLLKMRKGKNEPLTSELLKYKARGRLHPDICREIDTNHAFGKKLQDLVVDRFVESKYHITFRKALFEL